MSSNSTLTAQGVFYVDLVSGYVPACDVPASLFISGGFLVSSLLHGTPLFEASI